MKPLGLILDSDEISGLLPLARDAEAAGFDSIWATELYRTSFEQLSYVSSVTNKIKLGTAVALAFVRTPLITALTALDLDEISGGRLLLGLGTGAKRTNEMWHGVSHGKPVTRIKECIDVIRLVTERAGDGALRYEGEYYDINTKGYHRPFRTVRNNIPIYLAGVGGGMCRAAGEKADGYLGHVVCSERYLREAVLPEIRAGLESSGRERKEFAAASIITCAVSRDRKRAMEAARATIAFYGTVRTYEPPFRLHGFTQETAKIREAFIEGDVKSMIAAVSDDMVNTFAVVGSPDECRKRISSYRGILDLPILSAPHYYIDFEEVREYQKSILEVFGS
jgi:probable F420-dependent oxidoreductase